MSLGQLLPPPAPEEHCPHCGEVVSPSATMCWLCLEKFSVAEDSAQRPNRKRSMNAPKALRPLHGGALPWVIFGLLAFALCVALAFDAPGLLFVAVVVLAPLLIRAFLSSGGGPRPAALAADQNQQVHAPKSIRRQDAPASPIVIFVSGVASFIAVGMLACCAFCGAFLVVCTGGLIGVGAIGADRAFGGIIALALVAGIVAAIYVGISMSRTVWPRKD